MRTIFGMLVAAVAVLALAGCGHNLVTYSDGVGLETTLNPETYSFGVSFRYGKILTACVKEKSEVKLESGFTQTAGATAADAKGATTATGLEAKLSVKTGNQVTGYAVELAKVNAARAASAK